MLVGVAQGTNVKRRSRSKRRALDRYGEGKCETLEAAMGIVLSVSRIDHKVVEYLTFVALETSGKISEVSQNEIRAKMRNMSTKERDNTVGNHTSIYGINRSLKKIRKVRNGLAHCIDTITPEGVSGNYEKPVCYSIDTLKNTQVAADSCAKKLTRAFSKNARFVQWKKTGRLKLNAA